MRIQRWLLPYMLCAVASPQCPGSFSAQHVIASDSLKVQSIALGDINGDGLLDLAAASYGDNSIEWFPNEMTDIGTFGQKNIVTTGATGAQYVVVGDIDGDHFLDLISKYRWQGCIQQPKFHYDRFSTSAKHSSG